MEMIGKVRRMHHRDKKSVREISRVTGLSRNTVAKWLQGALASAPAAPAARRAALRAPYARTPRHRASMRPPR